MRAIFLIFLILSSVFSQTFEQQHQQPIKTIVVLVLENRSFDHMLGWMKKSVNPSINGVTGKECNSVSAKGDSKIVAEMICFSDDAEYVDPDPGHSFEDVEKQVFGSSSFPSMSGFVEQALTMSENLSQTVMKGFRPENVPIYAALVSEFAVFDRWFSSIPGPTQPNRLFVYSATSHGSTSHVKRQLATGYPQHTIFDSLHENGLDFGIYFQNVPTTLFYRNLRKLKYIFKFHQYDLKFKKDARNGKLPSLTVIEPRYFDLTGLPANDDHPSHDVANGQKLVKEVYETLRASPQWNETLLVITYDEHGGFYDHVQTPYVNVPNPDGNTGPAPYFFKFDRLGVRVPTIMVSPWIKKGTVISRPKGPSPNSEYEHSSIPATIKKMFNLSSHFLTHRDAWAGTFEHVVGQLTSPRTDCPEVLPEVVPLRKTGTDENRGLSEFQNEVVQLAAVLNGDHFLSSFPGETGKKMNVKEAHEYVRGAVSRFIRASKEASKLGADPSAIVDMRSSLTTRYDKRKCSCKNDLDTNLKPAIWSKNLVSLAIAVALIAPLPSSAIPSLSSKSFSLNSTTTPFSQAQNLPSGLENGKIRPCPSINPGCISSNPKSSNFAFPWRILGYSSNSAAIQQLQDALLKTQKNVKIQLVEDTPTGKYMQAEVDGGFGRDVLEFLVNGDVVSFRAMATKVTYVYPFTTALGDSKGQEERMKQILNELGWYAPSFDSMD
ncbi:UNVERIFIED_CONTAM: Non-specific phospholipase C6 [Sesamum indicum]